MKRLLFVDDEPRILEAIKARFYTRRKVWDMSFADSGAKAIELMRDIRFDLLVTDLRMPGIDGTSLVAKAKMDSPDTIRIVVSGYASEEQSQRLMSLAHRYLSKPCEPQLLEECIVRCFATQALVESDALRARLGAVENLPPVPGTFAALQRALSDPDVDAKMVGGIIRQDPALTAKLLHVCNSAFFRLPRHVSRIEQAVSYLGLSAVRSIVLCEELFKPGVALPAGLDLNQIQKHALSVGVLARCLAGRVPWADDAFLAGLLHDVGILLLGRQFRDQMQGALDANNAGVAFAVAEQQFIEIDHGTAGAYLLALWGIPHEVVEAVAYHDAPDSIAHSTFDILSAVVIAHALMAEIRPDEIPRHEADSKFLAQEYLSKVQYPHSWDSLLHQATGWLAAGEVA